ncbi:MAG: hypothetical protein IPL65_14510 [Lewinellaceae bacterium]|nr:hypothetical protein [Lewinellaceae bacterium]
MFQHILKLVWKKKRSNFLMMLEIFFSFIILFAVWTLGIYTWRNFATPSGIDIDNTWVVYLDYNAENDSISGINNGLVKQQLNAFPEIQASSFTSGNIPFGFSTMNWSKSYQEKSAVTDVISVEPDFPNVFGIKMKSGAGSRAPITSVISGQL